MIAVSVMISFIAGFGFFGDSGDIDPMPVDIDGENPDSSKNLLLDIVDNPDLPADMDLWQLIVAASGVGGVVGTVVLGIITGGNTQIMGAWLFSNIFWGSYLVMIDITRIGSFLPEGIIWAATGLMGIMFLGAIIGLLTGNG
jgi:hypothetical protein